MNTRVPVLLSTITLARKCEAFSPRGPFDSLIFYYYLTLEPGFFIFILWGLGVGGWRRAFLSLNLLIIIWYIV